MIDPLKRPVFDEQLIRKLSQSEAPIFLVVNKIDVAQSEVVDSLIEAWKDHINFKKVIQISALKKTNTDALLQSIKDEMPIGPAYFPKDQWTNQPERFFVREIIRESLLELYRDEIPYSCEVIVESFKEGEKAGKPIVRIEAFIFVLRDTQKAIVIGKSGSAIKKLGISSRQKLEKIPGQTCPS